MNMLSIFSFVPRSWRTALVSLALLTTARGEDAPMVMLDTGGHVALVKGLQFTSSGKYLVSAGEDKVIRVWDWEKGRTAWSLRGQSGPGKEGEYFALAVSPDERFVAAGGWFGADAAAEPCCGDVRIFDFASRKLVRVLRGHTNAVNSLAFSPDGHRLLSGSSDKTAILWDPTTGRAIHTLRSQGRAGIKSVAFLGNGAMAVTGADDGQLRFWRVSDGSLAAAAKASAGIKSLAPSTTANLLATGNANGEIELWDQGTGAWVRKLTTLAGPVRDVGFSRDGRYVIASCDCVDNSVVVLELATGHQTGKYVGFDNVVTAVASHPNGSLIASAGGANNEIHVWDLPSAKLVQRLAGTGRSVWSVGVLPDGQSIAWGHADACPDMMSCPNAPGKLEWALKLPTARTGLGQPEPTNPLALSNVLRANAQHGAWMLQHRDDPTTGGRDAVLNILENGVVRAAIRRNSKNGFRHSTYTFTPDGEFAISGGVAGVLALYNKSGQEIASYVGHTGQVWSTAVSQDGRLLISGSLDQTLRLWNVDTRELIATLFSGGDGDWIVWTPQGYYTGSPGADRIVGWQINRGADREADYVGADQLGAELNRPDIVDRAIILRSARQAVKEAANTKFQVTDLVSKQVPKFRILTSEPMGHVTQAVMPVKIAIEPESGPVKSIRVEVNGRQVNELTPDIGSGGFKAGEYSLDVPLASGKNEIRMTLNNAIGDSSSSLTVMKDGEGSLDERGKLYLVAVGVDKYPGLGNVCGADGKRSCDLQYAGADAAAFVEAVKLKTAGNYTEVVERLLTNKGSEAAAPTAANILGALDLFKDASVQDTIILYISGHGYNEGASYRFLPTNAELSGTGLKTATVVPWYAFQEALAGAKGRRILFADTCHAENTYYRQIGNTAFHNNIIAYTAARFDEEAQENEALAHGLFTLAVVEGLKGEAQAAAKRQITTQSLARYVERRVKALAANQQNPQYFRGRDAEDYILAHW